MSEVRPKARRREPTSEIRDGWDFGHYLRKARLDAHFLSMADAANAAGMSRQTWNVLETGWSPDREGGKKPYNPTIQTVATAARTVGLDQQEALAKAGLTSDPDLAYSQIARRTPISVKGLASRLSRLAVEQREALDKILNDMVSDELERELVQVVGALTPTQRQKVLAAAKRYAAANEKQASDG
jgi:DNA-binding XRE family transcriptional regulator